MPVAEARLPAAAKSSFRSRATGSLRWRPPGDGSFNGGLQGGFLLQNGTSLTGGATYAVFLPGLLIPCNIGNAVITGSSTTINGNQSQWAITAVAGTQTFTLTGIESFDDSTIAGTYTSTAGTSGDGAPCGTAQTGLQWSAVLVPPITGNIQGSFHSTGGAAGLTNRDFLVSGSLTQAQNTGASNATVSGTLSFTEPGTNASDYPCFATASVYGQISGNSVTLEMLGPDQSTIGEIGEPASSYGVTGLNPVTYESALGGYILHSVGPSYLVATNSCPGNTNSITTAGDYGDICLSVGIPLGSANACQEPITLVPAAVTLTYPPPPPAATSTQAVTLANSSGGSLSGLTFTFANIPPTANNFTETDNCGSGGIPSQGEPFTRIRRFVRHHYHLRSAMRSAVLIPADRNPDRYQPRDRGQRYGLYRAHHRHSDRRGAMRSSTIPLFQDANTMQRLTKIECRAADIGRPFGEHAK